MASVVVSVSSPGWHLFACLGTCLYCRVSIFNGSLCLWHLICEYLFASASNNLVVKHPCFQQSISLQPLVAFAFWHITLHISLYRSWQLWKSILRSWLSSNTNMKASLLSPKLLPKHILHVCTGLSHMDATLLLCFTVTIQKHNQNWPRIDSELTQNWLGHLTQNWPKIDPELTWHEFPQIFTLQGRFHS